MSLRFGAYTCGTGFAVVLGEFSESGPGIISANECESLVEAEVSRDWVIVLLL